MRLNETEKQIQDQLKEEIEIPQAVTDKIQDTFHTIHKRAESGYYDNGRSRFEPYRWMKPTAKACGAAAAALALGFLVCLTNPVLAKELPLVGSLFELLQNEVSFFGNFADKATVLEEPAVQMQATDDADAADGSADNTDGSTDNDASADGTAADGVYTKTCDGLTITFSEVYANEQTIYLTMLAESEEPFPDTMTGSTESGERPSIELNYEKNYSFLEESAQTLLTDMTNPEGIFLDEHTYSCILRIDLAADSTDYSEFDEKYQELTQQILDEMGVTLEDLNDETDEGYALLTQFSNEISSRNGALREYIKKLEVPESFTLGIDITSFVGTKAEPEYWDPGYSEEELAAMSEEEWREVMDQQPAEYRQFPNQYQNYWYEGSWSFEIPVTVDTTQTEVLELNETNADGIGLSRVIRTPYEITVYDKYDEGGYSDTFLVALDANGNKLPYNDSAGNCNNFAIQDRDISTVDIYILDYIQYMDELKGEERYNNNETKPEEEKWSTLLDANALYHKTIHFEER